MALPDINYVERYGESLVKGFNNRSETGDMFSQEGKFTGVYTYHDIETQTVPLTTYDVTQDIQTANRYGAPVDVGDIQYDYTVKEKPSFSAILDKTYGEGQLNMKTVSAFMEKQKNDRIAPYLDGMRMRKWAEGAGFHVAIPSGGLTKSNITEFVMDCHSMMKDAFVPEDLILTCTRDVEKKLKLSDEWVKLDSLAGKTLPKGTIAEFDGMAVKTMATSKFPAGVHFMITHKDAITSPTKVKEMNVFEKCENNSGSKINFLMICDAFVRGHKAAGVLVACDANKICAKPTITASSSNWAIASSTSGAVIKYTTDGSDPRYSHSAKVYTAAISVEAGKTIRAAATKDGMYNSEVTDKEV